MTNRDEIEGRDPNGRAPLASVEDTRAAAEAVLANMQSGTLEISGWTPDTTRQRIAEAFGIPEHMLVSDFAPVAYDLDARGNQVTGAFVDELEAAPADILDQIDAATGCQLCGRPLGDSPSDDFCSPEHFRAWHAKHAAPLPYAPDAASVHPGNDAHPVPLNGDTVPASLRTDLSTIEISDATAYAFNVGEVIEVSVLGQPRARYRVTELEPNNPGGAVLTRVEETE
jgi:hypothetical protein